MAGRRASPAHDYVVEDRGFTSPCWIWQRGMHRTGYGLGHERVDGGWRRRMAHIIYWERSRGPLAAGQEIDHLCAVRACVNPDHLEAVTHAENTRRDGRSRLTAEIADRIRAGNEPTRVLSARYGVSYRTIQDARAGGSWR